MRLISRLGCATAAVAWIAAVAVGQLAAQVPAQDHPGQYDRADIEAGSRLYSAQCAGCHGANGDQVAGVDLRRGQFKTVTSDEDLLRLLATGRPDAGMPAFGSFQPRELTGIVAFIRAGFDASAAAVKIGDTTRGAAVFAGKGDCASCHRVQGRGPRTASDLSDIGAIRSAAALQRALVDPAANLIPANRRVNATTRDGRVVRGRRLNEDTHTIQLLDEQDRLVSLTKADLRSLEIVRTTAMPPAAGRLTDGDVADLVAYLLSLKGLP